MENLLFLNVPGIQSASGVKNSPRRKNHATLEPEMDRKLLDFALNKSYTKKMAGYGRVNPDEITNTVTQFLLTFVNQEQADKQLQEFWSIVAVNEHSLKSTTSSSFCSSNYPKFDGDPNRLPLYQLFIGLGARQIRFRSLNNSSSFYVINMDTVHCELSFSDIGQLNSQNHMTIKVENKHEFDFYFTSHSLPFKVMDRYPADYSTKICSDMARQTERIIRQSIQESKGKLFKLMSKELTDPDWMEKRYSSVGQFDRYCQTGDILLFKDNHTFAKVQRFFTHSECDHVGMVFRDDRYGICIFESNGGTGVSLAMWTQLIRYKWFQNIEGIYWRRLNMQEKPQDFQDKIKQFIKVNLHKEYGISVGKLTASKQINYDDPQDEKNRTYFCSQLIAACYKFMGLLQKEKPSSTYIPKDFSDKGSINMINNSALEPARRIIFNKDILKETYRFYK